MNACPTIQKQIIFRARVLVAKRCSCFIFWMHKWDFLRMNVCKYIEAAGFIFAILSVFACIPKNDTKIVAHENREISSLVEVTQFRHTFCTVSNDWENIEKSVCSITAGTGKNLYWGESCEENLFIFHKVLNRALSQTIFFLVIKKWLKLK